MGFSSIGCLHRLFLKDGPTGSSDVIVAFNWSDEIFKEMPLPALLRIKYKLLYLFHYRLEVVRGCLGLVNRKAWKLEPN